MADIPKDVRVFVNDHKDIHYSSVDLAITCMSGFTMDPLDLAAKSIVEEICWLEDMSSSAIP